MWDKQGRRRMDLRWKGQDILHLNTVVDMVSRSLDTVNRSPDMVNRSLDIHQVNMGLRLDMEEGAVMPSSRLRQCTLDMDIKTRLLARRLMIKFEF
jgi:hypothetical protein